MEYAPLLSRQECLLADILKLVSANCEDIVRIVGFLLYVQV